MNDKALNEWRNRPLKVRVLDRCDECATLRDDVKERQNYWPNVKAICCETCFNKKIAAYGMTYC
jgi:hypothetical protein